MKQKTILLVDDEKFILSSLARDLASDTFEVALAASGEEAISKINTTSFDLVITDLMMQGVSGFRVLEAARQRDTHTMVIILTGYADLDAAVDAFRLGADDFLQKPCSTDELLCRMANCFAKQDLQRKVRLYEGLLPVCSYCRKIRDTRPGAFGKDRWYQLDEYFDKAFEAKIFHACCPDCYRSHVNPVHCDLAGRPNSTAINNNDRGNVNRKHAKWSDQTDPDLWK